MKSGRSALAVLAGAALAAGVARAAGPVSGSIAGPVTAVQHQTFTLRSSLSPTGRSRVHVASTTAITEEKTVSRTRLSKGLCVFAGGQKSNGGVVQATRLTVSAPVNGACQTMFRRRPGANRPPSGARRPPRTPAPRGNGGFAAGKIVAVRSSTVTVRGNRGTTKVAVSSRTQISELVRVTMSAIKVGLCTFVAGTSSDKGVNVTARSVSVFKPGANGCTGPRRR